MTDKSRLEEKIGRFLELIDTNMVVVDDRNELFAHENVDQEEYLTLYKEFSDIISVMPNLIFSSMRLVKKIAADAENVPYASDIAASDNFQKIIETLSQTIA